MLLIDILCYNGYKRFSSKKYKNVSFFLTRINKEIVQKHNGVEAYFISLSSSLGLMRYSCGTWVSHALYIWPSRNPCGAWPLYEGVSFHRPPSWRAHGMSFALGSVTEHAIGMWWRLRILPPPGTPFQNFQLPHAMGVRCILKACAGKISNLFFVPLVILPVQYT